MRCHKILVVEDDDAIRDSIVDLLSLEGYEAVPAHHGEEALEILRDRLENPCLIITDLMMPKMDGYELIKILKASDIIVSIPIVVITAGGAGVDKVDSSVSKVIRKPFSLDSLVRVVKEHCGSPNDGPITERAAAL